MEFLSSIVSMSEASFTPLQGLNVFAYENREAGSRRKQIEYYVLSKALSPDRVCHVGYDTYDDLKAQLLDLSCPSTILERFFLLCHGTPRSDRILFPGQEGELAIASEQFIHENRNFFFIGPIPRMVQSWVFCGAAFVLKREGTRERTFGSNSSTGCVTYLHGGVQKSVTCNIPLQGGQMAHSGLNPELLGYAGVQDWVVANLPGCTEIKFDDGTV
jgi:hypothetical protein